MKKSLFLFTLVLFSNILSASHSVGGAIYWRCLPNGQYVIYLENYRNCSGVPWNFTNQTITILSSVLPNNYAPIIVKPDSSKWLSYNMGIVSQNCNPAGGGVAINCSNSAEGQIQTYFYQSDPVTLTGTPPSDGWKLYWQDACCRSPALGNASGSSTTVLVRSIMYPPNGQTGNSCYDSSPIFSAAPEPIVCRGLDINYNFSALDPDGDSTVYSFDIPISPPQALPQSVVFLPGYAFDNPLPDASIDGRNKSVLLDRTSGHINFNVKSGGGDVPYIMVVRADSYRGGMKIASVFREMSITLIDCPNYTKGQENNSPTVKLDGKVTHILKKEYVAGDLIRIPISVVDSDVSSFSNQPQIITLIPRGLNFTITGTAGAPCQLFGNDPCAFLMNSNPYLDQNHQPPTFKIEGSGGLNTEFVWNPKCFQNGSTTSKYIFTFEIKDDHCPAPAVSTATMEFVIKAPTSIEAPYLNGISVNLDGTLDYHWLGPIDSIAAFSKYRVEGSRPIAGLPPLNWNLINPSLKKFQNTTRATNFPVYDFVNPLDVSSGPNLLAPFGTSQNLSPDFYLRMKTIGGCKDDLSSSYSNEARVMEVQSSTGGIFPNDPRSSVQLTWNRSVSSSPNLPEQIVSKSKTRFYVHMNDSIYNGGLDDEQNWKIIANSYTTSITTPTGLCDQFVGFRIEARDTIVSIKQGNSLHNPLYDTSYFSAFSLIDTFYFNSAKPLVESVNNEFLQTNLTNGNLQWIDCNTDNQIIGEDSIAYIPTKKGDFAVLFWNASCLDTSDCFTVSVNDSVLLLGQDSLISREKEANYQWINCKDNLPISGANEVSFVPLDTGYYAVILSKYAISDTSVCIPVFPVGLTENTFKNQIKLFPNPTTGKVMINLEKTVGQLEIQIRNNQGQLVSRESHESQDQVKFYINGEAGIYFIQIINNLGRRASFKMVKR